MSPRYFQALTRRHREIRKAEQERADLRAATIAKTIVNMEGGWKEAGDTEGTAAQVWDFFPWLKETLGADDAEGDVAALIADLKGRGARDLRGQ